MKKILEKKYRKTLISVILLACVLAAGMGIYTAVYIIKNLKIMAAMVTENYNYAVYPTPDITGKDASQIMRGEYLSKAGDCIACHTNSPEKGKSFAGGLPMPTPFGTIYTPNITPDKETGIGGWTDAQFIRAMRKGISPEGHYYYPAFPYYYFNKITDPDLKAIKAYLDSIPAVTQKNRPNEMMLPFNFRFLQLGWRMLFFRSNNDTGAYQEDPKQSATWNRGAYLVKGLGHCAMCHSPSYTLLLDALPLGAPIKKYDLTGAKIQGYLAPNISKSNLEKVSNEEIINVFTKDELIGGGEVVGPMLEVNHNSLRYLKREDLLAITLYLKTVESQSPPISSSGGPGAGVYEGYCSGCHAQGAGGAPKFGDATAWDPLIKMGKDKLYNVALHGKGGMPAKGSCLSCSVTDIKQAVDYMIAGLQGGGASTAAPTVSHEIPLTPADGKRIYEAKCSICHNDSAANAPTPGDDTEWETIIGAGFYDTFLDVKTGRRGHLPQGGCPQCSDAELKAAVKYMMQQSTKTYNYNLW
jgi:cytochrome c5